MKYFQEYSVQCVQCPHRLCLYNNNNNNNNNNNVFISDKRPYAIYKCLKNIS